MGHKLLGRGGAHTKEIALKWNVKVRLRGRGSGCKEGPAHKEANEPLMLCISATSQEAFDSATKDVEILLKDVYDQYHTFCNDCGKPSPKLVPHRVDQHEVALRISTC